MQMPNGEEITHTKGTPQGGVISPVLSNVFMHYAFDMWMTRNHARMKWVRYADDIIVHCKTEQEAKGVLAKLTQRFAECRVEVHPEKTKIVYCKDEDRRREYPNTKFTLLGFEFRRRMVRGINNRLFLSFTPAISMEARKNIGRTIRRTGIRSRSDLNIEQVAEQLNPMIRGWMNYYGKYNRSAMKPVMRQINRTLVKWCKDKYKTFRKSNAKACDYMINMYEKRPTLFVHWHEGKFGLFV